MTPLFASRRVADYHARIAPDPLQRELDRRSTEPPELQQYRLSSRIDVIYGKWVSGRGRLARERNKAVALGEMSEADAIAKTKQAVTLDDRGSVWAMPSGAWTFVWLRVSGWSAAPVVATPDAKFRVWGKLYRSTDVEFGISTHASNGGFAGKYSVILPADDLRRDGNAFDIKDGLLIRHADDMTDSQSVLLANWK